MAVSTLPTPEILDAKQRRLEQLQLQASRFGYGTPAEVANEIKDLQREIAAAAPATVAESHTILYDLLMENRADVRRILWIGLPMMAATLVIAIVALVVVLVVVL